MIKNETKKRSEQLFARYASRFFEYDPEFVELFERFAYDEVCSIGFLDEKTRIMCILASLIAMHTTTEYEGMLDAAIHLGISPVEIKEIIYQSTPYVGIARMIDFLNITNEYFEKNNIALPQKGQSTTTSETRFEHGLAVQKSIFHEIIDQNYKASPKNQLHMQKLLSANCFGDYYTRGGIDIKTRELITFAILISLGGCEPQVCGHIQGNVNVGNDKQRLLDVVTQLLPYIGYPRALNAIRCLNDGIPEKKEENA